MLYFFSSSFLSLLFFSFPLAPFHFRLPTHPSIYFSFFTFSSFLFSPPLSDTHDTRYVLSPKIGGFFCHRKPNLKLDH